LDGSGEQVIDEERRATFDDVYRGERARIVRLAYLLTRSEAVAEELAQEAFVRLYGRFDEVEVPGAFLHTATVRLAATWWRRDRMEAERLRLVPPVRDAELSEPDETWEALGRLRPERAIVLVLRFYEDLSQVEIARILDCPPATVRSRVKRGLADLRKELDR
jgi:RNA polymerase sigma factor (sigma-70 family)